MNPHGALWMVMKGTSLRSLAKGKKDEAVITEIIMICKRTASWHSNFNKKKGVR